MYDLLRFVSKEKLIIMIEILLIITIIGLVFILVLMNLIKKINATNRKVINRESKLEKEINKLTIRQKSLNKANNHHSSYLNSVFMTMRDGIIVFDKNKRIKLANPKAMEMLNLDNMIFFDYTFPEYKNGLDEILTRIDTLDYEDIFIRGSKDKFLQYRLTKIEDRYVDNIDLGYLLTVTDVSETEVNNRLRNEFIENISHEFKTPMTIILGNVETLKLWDDLDKSIRNRSLEVIDLEILRLNSMVDQLLSLTKINGQLELKKKEIDIIELVQKIVGQYSFYLPEKNIEFGFEFEHEQLYLNYHEETLINALGNIIENAIKYTVPNDTVTISISSDEEYCIVSVADNGLGIKESHLKRIFDRFYRLEKDRNSKTGGTGLGLSISKDSIEKLGGQLVVESVVDMGTTFTAKLPLMRNDE